MAPVVQEAGVDHLDLLGLPPASAMVELATDDASILRGVYVPASGDGPLVVHFLPSAASITTGVMGVAGLRQSLSFWHDLGYASLVVDYRGVGASAGRRDPRSLASDAWSVWREALARVDGDSSRIVLRAASIGAISASALLEGGAEPAALILIAPVLPDTIGAHAARDRHGAFLGGVIAPFLRSPSRVDVLAALQAWRAPMLLLLGDQDAYLPAADRARVVAAARLGGHDAVVLPGDHAQLVMRAYGFETDAYSGRVNASLIAEERAFLSALPATPQVPSGT